MGKRIVILGAGESGTGAALLAQSKGFDVFVSDFGAIGKEYKLELEKAGIPYEEKQHSEDKILNADTIIKSPGIPEKADIIVKARGNDIRIIGEIEFAAKYTNAKFLAITGSNGKTTTTLFTHHLLKSAGYKVGLAGNVGHSLARQVMDDKFEFYVLELSSFQLDDMYDFKADIAVLLNITPDHLDRYEYKFENYIDSKFRIARNQTPDDYFITFIDDDVVRNELGKREIDAFKLSISLQERMLNGAYNKGDKLFFNLNNHITSVFTVDTQLLPITGKHNNINVMAGILAATAAGVDEKVIIKALGSFKNAPHRLEEVAMINRVRYINDSKATNVDSVKYALDSYEKPIVWIAGGVDKGNDYSQIRELVYEKVVALICLGKDNEKLIKAFKNEIPMVVETDRMDEAVKIAREVAQQEGVVLLSPACASFDLFKNYEDRGEKFKTAVKGLQKSQIKNTLLSFTL